MVFQNHKQPNIVLASQSPRRKELLSQLGFEFVTKASDIDESVLVGESPQSYVTRMAKEKALAQDHGDQTLVIGSDTCVVFEDKILGKPKDVDDAKAMLAMLSGNTHQVLTAVAIAVNHEVDVTLVTTDVTFKALSAQEILNYWRSGEPKDKAGSYGIQGIAGQFVTGIKGSYSAVVGLPLYETAQLMAKHGCPTSMMQS
ncbi:septum formation inhibitor Maf [Thalassotalea sp. LPB0316]|uniref:Maf family protein n=1 Tax=Thalassotalea sp. LPB0316 TaxID=2769490 RepID=UPI0018684AA7|nr:Maf family protein [Thalassotalea sp. LPB0316]QOL26759.1 septum formation inhibitor Maf [Thalassotalea sp. LPB0316]